MAPHYDIVGIGVVVYDMMGTLECDVQMGQKQPLNSWEESGGGPVPTALVAASRLGARTCLLGVVGDDTYGQALTGMLEAESVGIASSCVRKNTRTQVAFVLVEPGLQRRTLLWYRDQMLASGFVPDQEKLKAARILLIDTNLLDAEIVAARQMYALGKPVVLDTTRYNPAHEELLPFCTHKVVPETYAQHATGYTDPADAAQALFDKFGGIVVVTAGEYGSWCASANETFYTPAFDVQVHNTNGAGDVFHGAFVYGLLQDWALPEIVRFASAAAALKCCGSGWSAIPQLSTVEQLLASGQHRVLSAA